jgi:DNA-binding NarL/FixJ family response regulator
MGGSMYVPPAMLGLVFQRPPAEGDTVPDVMRIADPADERSTAQSVLAEPHPKPPTLEDVGLTPRQTEVLGLLLQGLPNKLIARQLNLSVETVKDHVAAVLRALGVSSRTQAVLAVSQMTQGQGGWFTRRTPPR